MKLPKRLRERRDTFVSENVGDNDIDGFDMGYNQGVEDLMSEVQGLVEALDYIEEMEMPYSEEVTAYFTVVTKALSKWHAFCEVEKDEE